MKIPTYERGITKALVIAIEQLDGDSGEDTASVRLGTTKLNDGREAQIHITLTANPDDFLEEGE